VTGGDPRASLASAGALLRAAREAAGLSQDAVAQQLKLAPRQVRAIEEDDYARLPGRTFVRGFVRNYARLLRVDPDAVVAALPSHESGSPLDRPTLTPTARPMAELRVQSERRNTWSRWLIPLALLAIVAVAAVYEFTRASPGRRAPVDAASAPATAPAPPAATQGTALPNPLVPPKADGAPPAAASPVKAGAEPAPALPVTAVPPPSLAAPAAAAASAATLLLTFNATSWVEVKDGKGVVIYLQTGTAGTSQTLAGTPPLDVAIGNAAGVGVAFRGQAVNLAPYTHANIARMLLR
jgi:cytoskeleton protein RodZ